MESFLPSMSIINLQYQGGLAYEDHLKAEIKKHLHQEECLLANIRLLRQCLRNITEAVLAGQSDALLVAAELRAFLSASEV